MQRVALGQPGGGGLAQRGHRAAPGAHAGHGGHRRVFGAPEVADGLAERVPAGAVLRVQALDELVPELEGAQLESDEGRHRHGEGDH
ncbi:MAG: hypothetical protein ACK559_30790, partial [bacterium]